MTGQKKVIFTNNPIDARTKIAERLFPQVKAWTLAGHKVKITADIEARTLDQNAIFHAICGDIEKSKLTFAGKERSLNEWKILMVSGHAIATKETAEVVTGLEGEIVLLRESTAEMGKVRKSSLIEYTKAWAVGAGVILNDGLDGHE